jgi:hypothetical protein
VPDETVHSRSSGPSVTSERTIAIPIHEHGQSSHYYKNRGCLHDACREVASRERAEVARRRRERERGTPGFRVA